MSDLKRLLPKELEDDNASQNISLSRKKDEIPHKWNSIRVVYVVMFFTSVSYSIQMPSLWPYMNVIDRSYTKDFMGWVVAAYSIGQLITCPIFSYISGRTGHFKLILIFSSILAIGGNYLYAIIVDIPGSTEKRVCLLASRVIIGISGSNVAAIRLFLTLATTEEERIGPMATLSACQAIGFIMGPGIQAALVPLRYPGVYETPFFRINMYTASGLFSVLTSFIILILIICLFKDDFLQKSKDSDYQSTIYESTDRIPLAFLNDYKSAVFMLIAFFICMGTLSVMETCFTPMTMDNFAWSKSKATLINSIILACVGVCSLAVFFCVRLLTKIMKEKFLLIIAFALCLGSTILLIPMGNEPIPIDYSYIINVTNGGTSPIPIIVNNATGCDITLQPWCKFVPALEMWQFGCSLVLLTFGYPAANVLSYVIFSRLVNPSAQSLWMGLLTASGSFARIVGPIFISMLYVHFGLQVSFGAWSGLILLFLCFTPWFSLRMAKIEMIKSLRNSVDNANNLNG